MIAFPVKARMIAVMAVLLMALGGCGLGLGTGSVVNGSGTLMTEMRPVRGFTAVTLSGVGSLLIQQTGTESLTITTDDNLLPLIDVGVQGNILNIHTQTGVSLRPSKSIVYLLTVKDLNSMQLSGVGTLTIAQFKTTNLAVNLSGATSATISGLTVTSLMTTISGSGSMQLAGKTQAQNVTCSGTGTYDATQLASSTATLHLSGVGKAKVRVSDTLDVTITGVGSVTYFGNPTVTKHITGNGTVQQG